MPGGVSIPFKLDEESSPLRRAPFRAATLPKPKTPQSAEKLKKGFRKSAFRRTPRRKQIENDESKVVILPYCHHHVRPCVCVSLPKDISETVSRIAFILHTNNSVACRCAFWGYDL